MPLCHGKGEATSSLKHRVDKKKKKEFYKYRFQQQVETRLEGGGRGWTNQLEGDPEGAGKQFKLGLVHGREEKAVFLLSGERPGEREEGEFGVAGREQQQDKAVYTQGA